MKNERLVQFWRVGLFEGLALKQPQVINGKYVSGQIVNEDEAVTVVTKGLTTVPLIDKASIPSGTLPGHCRIRCGRCIGIERPEWNRSDQIVSFGENTWHILSNPMSWGAKNPITLVLGVSKGVEQNREIETQPHDKVPCAGFRPALTKALQLLKLLGETETIDEKINALETDWAFGSAVRCSLGLVEGERIVRSGGRGVPKQLGLMDDSDSWIQKCTKAFLDPLPSRLRFVVLLSNDDDYVQSCYRAFRTIDPQIDYLPGNKMAYSNGRVTFVHIVHVGGPGKNHIQNWFRMGHDKQGTKASQAREAILNAKALVAC